MEDISRLFLHCVAFLLSGTALHGYGTSHSFVLQIFQPCSTFECIMVFQLINSSLGALLFLPLHSLFGHVATESLFAMMTFILHFALSYFGFIFLSGRRTHGEIMFNRFQIFIWILVVSLPLIVSVQLKIFLRHFLPRDPLKSMLIDPSLLSFLEMGLEGFLEIIIRIFCSSSARKSLQTQSFIRKSLALGRGSSSQQLPGGLLLATFLLSRIVWTLLIGSRTLPKLSDGSSISYRRVLMFLALIFLVDLSHPSY